MSPTSIQICLQTREVHRNHNALYDYTYTGRSRKQGSYILALLVNEGASDRTSCGITKAAKPHGLRDTLQQWTSSMLKGRTITAKFIREKLEGSVAKSCPQRGILWPLPYCLVIDRSHRGAQWEWMLYTGVWTTLISRKFPITASELPQVLGMEQQWCERQQSSIHPQNIQHWDQHFMKPGPWDKIC